MKTSCSFFIIALILLIAVPSKAQNRYVEEVFTNSQIQVSRDIPYGVNATIFPFLFEGETELLPEDLLMDVYEPNPSIDVSEERAVVMVVHGGDALPRLFNDVCWGDKSDTVSIVTARKLARMGFVAVVPNYRLGWNYTSFDPDERLDGFIDACVRIQQDLKACARYLRKTISEDGNPYHITTDQFALWGTETSAGIFGTFAVYLQEGAELETPHFFVENQIGEPYNAYSKREAGNYDGTVVGIDIFNDTTNYVNWPSYSSSFQMTALASPSALDPGFIDADEPPMVMFGNPQSPITQEQIAPITLSTFGQLSGDFVGSRGIISEIKNKNVNAAWGSSLDDIFTLAQRADPFFGEFEGWFPLYGHPDNESPWIWWDDDCLFNEESYQALPNEPEDNLESLRMKIDSMAGYFGVRACISLDLNCTMMPNAIAAPILDQKLVKVYPNPARGSVQIETSGPEQTILSLSIMHLDGRLVRQTQQEKPTYKVRVGGLSPGYYYAIIQVEDGILIKSLAIL